MMKMLTTTTTICRLFTNNYSPEEVGERMGEGQMTYFVFETQWLQWCRTAVLELRRKRQEDQVRNILSYMVSWKLAWTIKILSHKLK